MNDEKNLIDRIIYDSFLVSKEAKRTELIPKSPNPLTLSKWYAEEIKWANSQIDFVEKKNDAICTCTKGCHACCRQVIMISSAEILAIKPYLAGLTREQRKALFSKTSEICKKLKENGIDDSNILYLGEEACINIQKRYFDLNIECPLLDKTGACSIYPVRPSLCWSYRNYGDPKECDKSYSVETTIKYEDWEKIIFDRLLIVKKPSRKGMGMLPNALLELLKEMI